MVSKDEAAAIASGAAALVKTLVEPALHELAGLIAAQSKRIDAMERLLQLGTEVPPLELPDRNRSEQ